MTLQIQSSFRRTTLVALLAFGGLAISIQAQLPLARLHTVFPPGGRAGSTVEVAVAGVDLDDATRIYFSHAGIKSAPAKDSNKFTVTIGAEAPPGLYEARVVGRYGVSNPRVFVVGDLPETVEPSGNNSAESAAIIASGTTVNGRVSANAVDYFKLTAKQGQRLLIECVAKAIDSRMDTVLSLVDANGRELERNRRGGVLDFTAPADGGYLLKVHDFTYRGGEEFFYRLTVSTAPRIDFIFPPAGQPGTKSKFMVYGRNLPEGALAKDLTIDGKPLEKAEVEIELPRQSTATPDAVFESMDYRLTTPDGVSNPALIGLTTAPVVIEQEPNNQSGAAQKISPPCEVAGQFYPANDADWFVFDAKKSDAYWVEVFSQRLGLPTSPFVLIQRVTKNDKGEEQAADVQEVYESDANVGGTEFSTRTRDPAARFEAKEDGAYRVQVRDLFNRSASSPRHVYRLSLRRETPDFRLVALAQPPPPGKDKKDVLVWTPTLRRGETWPVKVLALRRDGFNGDIQLSVENVPAGVTAAPAKIESGKNTGLVWLSAAQNAAGWVGPIKVVGRAKAGDAELKREARGGSVVWGVNDPAEAAVQSRITRDLVLAVTSEPAPLSVAAGEDKVWEAPKGGKLKIPLKVTRRGDFNASLKLKATGLAALDSLKELEVDGKAADATLEIDLAQQKLSPGDHVFFLQTQTPGKYRKDIETIEAAEAEARAAGKQVKDLSTATKQATEASEAATKAVKDAESAAKSATESEAAEAEARIKTATKAKAAADKAATEAAAKLKDAEARKTELTKKAKELTDKNKPKDVTITIYSTPIRLKVLPAGETSK